MITGRMAGSRWAFPEPIDGGLMRAFLFLLMLFLSECSAQAVPAVFTLHPARCK